MLRELKLWHHCYNELRPYALLFGATPAEVLEGRLPASSRESEAGAARSCARGRA